jgi:glycosyltransferase involved in cell wall biosynthesis
LVVDDGSTDDTPERVKKYGSRIEYCYKTNGGQASALNLGIAKSRGEIIALLDADDLFLPGKLARIADAFQKDPTLGMVYHRLQEWHMQTDLRRDWDFVPVSGDIHTVPDEFHSYVPQPTSSVSFRRTSLNPLLPIPEEIRMLADCYIVALIPFVSPILAIPEVLAVYRIHGTNSYSTDEGQTPIAATKKRLQMWQIVIEAMHKWLANNGYSDKQPPMRSFLARWSLLGLQEAQFQIDPPGRLRFFLFLIKQNFAYRYLQTWKLTLFNYVYALSALILGYSRADRFYKSRETTMNRMQQAIKRLRPARHPE